MRLVAWFYYAPSGRGHVLSIEISLPPASGLMALVSNDENSTEGLGENLRDTDIVHSSKIMNRRKYGYPYRKELS